MADSLPPEVSHPAPDLPRGRKRRAVPRFMVKRGRTAALFDQGVSTWDRLVAAGLTPAPVRLGGGLFWNRAELREWALHGCPDRATWAPIWRSLLAARAARRGR